MKALTLARPVAGLLTAALALLTLVAGAAPAQALAYDSIITGKVVGPDGKPVPGLTVIPYADAALPFGSSPQDMAQFTTTQADGSYSFKADSATAYKVRFMDDRGAADRKPLTFADKWYGGQSGFNDEAGYASAKQITFAPGVVQLATSTVAPATLPKYRVTSAPTISGQLKYGGQLVATPGTWSHRPLLGWSYAWYRGTTKIGAGQTLTVSNQVGQSIHVVVSASLWSQYGYTEAKSAEVSIPAVKLPAPGVTIQGKAQVSDLLTAVLAVPAGLDQAAVNAMASPQWYRNGTPIRGATELTYRPVPADAGAVLSFKAGGLIHPEVKTAKIAPRPFYASISAYLQGTPKPGSTITVYVGTWDPRPSAFAYQWYRSGVRIPGATAKSYKLSSSDAGRTIMVKATGTRTGFQTTTSASVRVLR